MYRSIFVPLDGELHSEHALPVAISIARRSGARLALARVHVRQRGRSAEATRDEARLYLERLLKALPDENGVRTSASVLEGDIAAALLDCAAEVKADLIVMTSHERDLLGDGWGGDIKDQIVSQAPLPVLVVHPHATDPDLNADIAFQHVLIGLNGSDHDEDILTRAVDLGRLTGAKFTLLRVTLGLASSAAMTPNEMLVTANVSVDLVEDLQREGKAYLEQLAEPLRAQGLQVQTVAISDQPGEEILAFAQAHQVDLMAMTTDKRSEFARWLTASTADRVSRQAGVPVLQFQRQPS